MNKIKQFLSTEVGLNLRLRKPFYAEVVNNCTSIDGVVNAHACAFAGAPRFIPSFLIGDRVFFGGPTRAGEGILPTGGAARRRWWRGLDVETRQRVSACLKYTADLYGREPCCLKLADGQTIWPINPSNHGVA